MASSQSIRRRDVFKVATASAATAAFPFAALGFHVPDPTQHDPVPGLVDRWRQARAKVDAHNGPEDADTLPAYAEMHGLADEIDAARANTLEGMRATLEYLVESGHVDGAPASDLLRALVTDLLSEAA